MIHHIIEAYGIGALSMQQLFNSFREKPREIIDVEYEDLSDQIENNQLPASEPNITEPLLIPSNYADSNNE